MIKCKLLFVFLLLFFISGCDYIPHEQFEIETKSGDVITISCPVIDSKRSRITYFIDGECIIVK